MTPEILGLCMVRDEISDQHEIDEALPSTSPATASTLVNFFGKNERVRPPTAATGKQRSSACASSKPRSYQLPCFCDLTVTLVPATISGPPTWLYTGYVGSIESKPAK